MRILSKSKSGQPGTKQLGHFQNLPNGEVRTGRLRSIPTLIKHNEAKGVTFDNIQGAIPTAQFASLTTALTGLNNDIKYTAKVNGVAGNSIRVRYVNGGVSQALSVVVAGNDITVNLATDAGSLVTSTASQVLAAVLASAPAIALVGAALAGADTGAGLVTVLAYTNLAGGTDRDKVYAGPGIPSTTSATILAKGKTAAPGAGKRRIRAALAGPLRKR